MRTRSASVSQFWVRWSTSVSTAEVSKTSSTCCKEKVQVELEVQMGWYRKSNWYGFRHSKLAFDLILTLSMYIIFQWFLTLFRRGEGNITKQSFEQLIKDCRKYNYWNQKPSTSIPYDSVFMKCSLIDRTTMADLSVSEWIWSYMWPSQVWSLSCLECREGDGMRPYSAAGTTTGWAMVITPLCDHYGINDF